jgi:methionine salvage enolase-phosphatase E1
VGEKLLNIETNVSDEWNAVITDSKGAQIKQIQFQKSTQLDINNYSPGVYYIQLTSKEEVLNYKFIKK